MEEAKGRYLPSSSVESKLSLPFLAPPNLRGENIGGDLNSRGPLKVDERVFGVEIEAKESTEGIFN